jgi:hypothetical protein
LANLLTVNDSLSVTKKVPALRVEAYNVEEKLDRWKYKFKGGK